MRRQQTKGKHGGQRANAGRRPLLTEAQERAIGARCERYWRDAWNAAEKTAQDAALRNVMPLAREALAVPIAERKHWRKRTTLGATHSARVKRAFQQDQRTVKAKPKRPWRVHKAICVRVAAEFSAKLGKPITPRMVKMCWDEIRALLKDD